MTSVAGRDVDWAELAAKHQGIRLHLGLDRRRVRLVIDQTHLAHIITRMHGGKNHLAVASIRHHDARAARERLDHRPRAVVRVRRRHAVADRRERHARAIRADALEHLLEFGREAFDHHGGVVLYFDKAARRRLSRAAFSMIELIVAFAIFSICLATGL